ncbi:MAG: hypothetical protein C3F18_00520 [Nitrosomonadales bacterium]|nr:MAG: hypothetical protein C3F18_00520 [Nitrosomonadales bacterium]
MKRLMVTSLVLLAGISGGAMADCNSNTKVTGSKLNLLITGNTVCAARGAEKWQEQHRAGGALWDFKKGPTDKVDPTKQVGTWSIASNSVTYSYTGGPSYTYSVHGPEGGPYSFCSSGAEIVSGAMFLPGSSSCP